MKKHFKKSLYDSIKWQIRHVRQEWKLCKGCHFFHFDGRLITCKRKHLRDNCIIKEMYWHKVHSPKPDWRYNCPRRFLFEVFETPKWMYEPVDIERCKTCSEFKLFSEYKILYPKSEWNNGKRKYGCSFLGSFRTKEEFEQFFPRYTCRYKEITEDNPRGKAENWLKSREGWKRYIETRAKTIGGEKGEEMMKRISGPHPPPDDWVEMIEEKVKRWKELDDKIVKILKLVQNVRVRKRH